MGVPEADVTVAVKVIAWPNELYGSDEAKLVDVSAKLVESTI